jgi:carbonic anhydrase/acetyltransferase-like protein (isoleucine patch superfamily)
MGGFLTGGELAGLGERGVEILGGCSCLISPSVAIAAGVRIYPNVILEADEESSIEIGPGTVLYPGAFVLATGGGEIVVGRSCELGPGGAQLKANRPGARIRLGDGVRLLNGCEVTGVSELGDGAQVIGAVTAQSVRLEGGRGGHAWPDPDERGAVLKGFGLAREVHLRTGEVLNLTPSFAAAPVERQASYHSTPGAA